MVNEFGNINKMTLDQFEIAMKYYEDKIAAIKEDSTISESTKDWFLELYNTRVAFLNKTFKELQTTINAARSSGKFVNEATATLDSLSRSKTDIGSLSQMSQNKKKYKVKQAFKIVGAVLLPLVGTIPFLVSFKRAKKRFKDINKALVQENIDLGNFVNESQKPYEKSLLTRTPFSERDMQNMLDHQTEIIRLQNILATPISPIEKKNLTAKLLALKEYAQKNGYSLDPGVLNGPEFKTKTDEKNNTVNQIKTDTAAVPVTPAKLNEVYNRIQQLQTLKEKAEALLSPTAKDPEVQARIADIDGKIATLKTIAIAAVENGATNITADLNSKVTTSAARVDLQASNSDLESVYTSTAEYGVDIKTAKKMAEEIGVPPEKVALIDGVTSTYDSLKAANDTKLKPFLDQDKYASLLSEAETILNDLETLKNDATKYAALTLEEIIDANSKLSIANSRLTEAKGMSPIVSDKLNIADLLTKYSALNSEYTKKLNTTKADEKDISALETKIKTTKLKARDSLTDVQSKATSLKETLELMQNEEYMNLYISTHSSSDYATLMSQGKSQLATLETRSKELENGWDTYLTEFNNNKLTVSDDKVTIPVKKAALEDLIIRIEAVKDSIPTAVSTIAEIKVEINKLERKSQALASAEAAAEQASRDKAALVKEKEKDVKDFESEFNNYVNAFGSADKTDLALKVNLFLEKVNKYKTQLIAFATANAVDVTELTNKLDLLIGQAGFVESKLPTITRTSP